MDLCPMVTAGYQDEDEDDETIYNMMRMVAMMTKLMKNNDRMMVM